jgi:hypothetical protein
MGRAGVDKKRTCRTWPELVADVDQAEESFVVNGLEGLPERSFDIGRIPKGRPDPVR